MKEQIRWVGMLVAIMLVVQLMNTLTLGGLSQFGILPRTVQGLLGIPIAPLIHHGWIHLLSNLIPFVVLMLLVAQLGKTILWQSTLGIVFLGGLGVWLLGGAGVHAGSSGLIFGYWSFLLAYSWFNRSFKSILIAVVVLLVYGGLFFSFLSFRPHISWASHLYGALAGVVMAWWLGKSVRRL